MYSSIMVSKVILSCVVFGFVLISCNGRHTTSQDRSLLEAEDMGTSFHKLNNRGHHGISHDMLRENTDSTFWMTSGSTRDEERPIRMHYRNQPEDDSSRKYGRNDQTRRSGYSDDAKDERMNRKHNADFKSTVEASDEQKYGLMRSDMRNRQDKDQRRHHQLHSDDSEEYSMQLKSQSDRSSRQGETSGYQHGRKIKLVTSQEQSRESAEGLQVQKVSHNTDPQQAGNARRKSNYVQSRGQESHRDVNHSQEDVANKIYKKNN